VPGEVELRLGGERAEELSDWDFEPHPDELLASHQALHKAAVKHAEHRSHIAQLNGRPLRLPVIPKEPPVCSAPPPMRFCNMVKYPVYRASAAHTFAQLDFDSHEVFKKIVPHMRISERHFELATIQKCRTNFRQFLCLRNFPRCCHIGLCNKYGAPQDLSSPVKQQLADVKTVPEKATVVTFVNSSQTGMIVDAGRKDAVKVKVAEAVCLQYLKTYTPHFECKVKCKELLSNDCLFMLSQDCNNLCDGVHSDQCANHQLYQIATGKESGVAHNSPGWLPLLASIVAAVYFMNAKA